MNNVQQTFLIFVVAALVLAIFQSASLQTWIYDFEPGPVSDALSRLITAWHEAMETIGAAKVTQIIRDIVADIFGP